MSADAIKAFIYMSKIDILEYITIHLKESVNIKQNGCHAYDVFEHLMRSMQCAVDKNYPLEIRLAALFHDIGKPKTRVFSKEKNDFTFYNHEVIGTKMTKVILNDLKFSHETIEKVTKLIRWHMFFSDTDQITHSAVRRMIANVGRENIWDLINLRICDRVGTGRPKEDPYRLRKYMSIIEEVMSDPTDVSMLKIGGNDLIEMLHVTPGPIIGKILNILLDKCLDDPSLNTKESLMSYTILL
jgi:tRNA nucleotidyltransferase (CCA-adding enzyme)